MIVPAITADRFHSSGYFLDPISIWLFLLGLFGLLTFGCILAMDTSCHTKKKAGMSISTSFFFWQELAIASFCSLPELHSNIGLKEIIWHANFLATK
jgi:hypothetical protein